MSLCGFFLLRPYLFEKDILLTFRARIALASGFKAYCRGEIGMEEEDNFVQLTVRLLKDYEESLGVLGP